MSQRREPSPVRGEGGAAAEAFPAPHDPQARRRARESPDEGELLRKKNGGEAAAPALQRARPEPCRCFEALGIAG